MTKVGPTTSEAADRFQNLLLLYGAEIQPRDKRWLDYTEPKNVFTRNLKESE